MIDSEIVGAVIGPLLTGMLAVLAYAFQQWRSHRRWQDERDRAIAQAIQEVQYIDTWLSALQRLERIDHDHEAKLERALLDLERSYQVMSEDLADDQPRPQRRTLRQHIGWFLLIPSHGAAAKTVRVLYWVMLSAALIWVVAVFATLPENLEEGLGAAIAASVILTIIAVVPALLVALWARYLDRRALANRQRTGERPPVGPFQAAPNDFPAPWPYPPAPPGPPIGPDNIPRPGPRSQPPEFR